MAVPCTLQVAQQMNILLSKLRCSDWTVSWDGDRRECLFACRSSSQRSRIAFQSSQGKILPLPGAGNPTTPSHISAGSSIKSIQLF